MPEKESKPPLRISKTHGWVMIAVGIFFDILPLLSVLLVTMLAMWGVHSILGGGGSGCGGATGWFSWFKNAFNCTVSWVNGVVLKIVIAGVGVGVLVFGGAIIYTVASWVSTVLAYIIFTIWFLFKRVNIWSFDKASKFFVSIGTMITEMVPILDLLPGTTFFVWSHVKTSQTEDTIKFNENIRSQARAIQEGGKRQIKSRERASQKTGKRMSQLRKAA